MQTIRWGILGPGGIAATFVKDLIGARAAGETSIELAAVGARDLDRAQEFATRFGIPHAHGGYADLVADPDVDAVYIATPHALHHEQALLAIRAGKHVLVEKAFTLNAREAQEVVDAAAEAGVVALEAMWTRFLPQTRALHEVLDRGEIGELRVFVGTHVQSLATDPAHRLHDPALGGGALLDLGVYPVSFAHDLLGAPTEVRATGVLTPRRVDARTSIVLEHAGGASSLIHTALDLRGHNPATLTGTAGRIEIDGPFFSPGGFTVYDADGAVTSRYDADEQGLRGMHHQALELARLVAEAKAEAGVREAPAQAQAQAPAQAQAQARGPLTSADTVDVMRTMDEVRRQIGVAYPADAA